MPPLKVLSDAGFSDFSCALGYHFPAPQLCDKIEKMPKLACKYGYIHDLSPIPDAGFRTIPDKRIDDLINHEDPKVRDAAYSEHGRLLYECLNCHRIMWDKLGNGIFPICRLEK